MNKLLKERVSLQFYFLSRFGKLDYSFFYHHLQDISHLPMFLLKIILFFMVFLFILMDVGTFFYKNRRIFKCILAASFKATITYLAWYKVILLIWVCGYVHINPIVSGGPLKWLIIGSMLNSCKSLGDDFLKSFFSFSDTFFAGQDFSYISYYEFEKINIILGIF